MTLVQVSPVDGPSDPFDEQSLVERARTDRDAFAELYRLYFDRVYGYMRLAVRESHTAEDATQQVFVNVFEALPRYERRSQPFRAWLFVIARNEALRSVRKTSRVELVDPAELSRRRDLAADEADLHALDWISDGDLLLFMERLPLAQRQALALRYMLDLSHREIAAILGRSYDDVRVLLHRAQRFLRARLTAVGRDPTRDASQRMLSRVPEATVLRARRFRLLGHRPGASAGPR
jgi:RNA polymerase sigma-70 factor (ECF subfamily)